MHTDNEKSCLFGEELVGYIYNELPVSDRAAFEDHLSNCDGCAFDFAAVAESRLGVYEWHRDEFVPLATPRIATLFAPKEITAYGIVSWIGTFRGLFSKPRYAFAGAAFAIVATLFGAYLTFFRTSGDLMADAVNRVSPIVASTAAEDRSTVVPEPEVAANGTSGDRTEKSVERQSRRSRLNAVPVKYATRTISRKPEVRAGQFVSVPSLGTYVEASDNSLRLADLVAELDTYDY